MNEYVPEKNDLVKILLNNDLKIEGTVLLWDEKNKKIVLSTKVKDSYFIINNIDQIIAYQLYKNKKDNITEQPAPTTYQFLFEKKKILEEDIEKLKNNNQIDHESKIQNLIKLQQLLSDLDKEIIKYKLNINIARI